MYQVYIQSKNQPFASLLNKSLSCLFITQQASIISPFIVSALKLILFIVLIIKALRTTRNIKHAGLRAVIKVLFSLQRS